MSHTSLILVASAIEQLPTTPSGIPQETAPHSPKSYIYIHRERRNNHKIYRNVIHRTDVLRIRMVIFSKWIYNTIITCVNGKNDWTIFLLVKLKNVQISSMTLAFLYLFWSIISKLTSKINFTRDEATIFSNLVLCLSHSLSFSLCIWNFLSTNLRKQQSVII